MRKFAQHYLNGLRLFAFLVRHGFNRARTKHYVRIYESLIYPIIYHNR